MIKDIRGGDPEDWMQHVEEAAPESLCVMSYSLQLEARWRIKNVFILRLPQMAG